MDRACLWPGEGGQVVDGLASRRRAGPVVHRMAVETEPLPAWGSLSDADREGLDFRRAIYAARIDRLDQNVGRIVARLRERGVLLVDVVPTLCEVAGATYPQTFRGKSITPAQGISMAAFLRGPAAPVQPRTLCWQHESNAVIREGDWKLVTANDRDERAWELYDLAEDRGESQDLRAAHPDIAQRLERAWRQWAQDARVVPYPERRDGRRRLPWPDSGPSLHEMGPPPMSPVVRGPRCGRAWPRGSGPGRRA